MYFAASDEMTDQVVQNLRDFFLDVDYYGRVTNRDYSVLGRPYSTNDKGEQTHLISASFPDRFKLYPHILITCSINSMPKFEADNVLLQADEYNKYGRRDVKGLYKGGDVVVNVLVRIRDIDKRSTQKIADAVSFWSTTYGWDYFKKRHWFMEPIRGATITVENLLDTTDSYRVFATTLNTTSRGSWWKLFEDKSLILSGFNIEKIEISSTYDTVRQVRVVSPFINFVDNIVNSVSDGVFSALNFTDLLDVGFTYSIAQNSLLNLVDTKTNSVETADSVVDIASLVDSTVSYLEKTTSQESEFVLDTSSAIDSISTLATILDDLSVSGSVQDSYETNITQLSTFAVNSSLSAYVELINNVVDSLGYTDNIIQNINVSEAFSDVFGLVNPVIEPGEPTGLLLTLTNTNSINNALQDSVTYINTVTSNFSIEDANDFEVGVTGQPTGLLLVMTHA